MRTKLSLLVLTGWFLIILASPIPGQEGKKATKTQVEVYASGLINPRGMAFFDGALYVAESGKPGDVMVPLPVNFGGRGPIGTNGRISRIPAKGPREDFITGLPNIGLYGGGEMLGPTSLAVLDGKLYELAAGHMTKPPTLSRVEPTGKLTTVVDIGDFNRKHPAEPTNGDAVPQGNPYDMVALDGALYITDGNYNRVFKATPDGKISIVYTWENSPVTVGITAGPDGKLYVCQFSPAPYHEGTGTIDWLTPDGKTDVAVPRLTTPIDVAIAPDGTMYVLQFAALFKTDKLRYAPGGGRVLRVTDRAKGTTEPVVTGLVFPTSMIFGPDGALYVSNYGNESNKGQGQVLRIVPGEGAVEGPTVEMPSDLHSHRGNQIRPKPPKPPEGTVTGATVTMVDAGDAKQWGYEPKTVTIQPGQAVEFINRGRMDHNASDSRGAFDSGTLLPGENVRIRLDEPGEYNYFCQPHPWMKGKIIVAGESKAPPKAASGPAPEEPPPTISPWKAAGVVGGIVVVVFGAGFLTRRRPVPPGHQQSGTTPHPQPKVNSDRVSSELTMTTQPEEREPLGAEAKLYVQRLIDDVAQLRLPELFSGDYPDAVYRIKNRNGVSVVALPTTSLTTDQHIKLMRYRLAQYLSVNFVDAEMVHQKRLEHEPLTNLQPRDVHYIATSVEGGEILCYIVLEAPPEAAPGATLRDRERPLFPVEKVHGYGIYNRLRVLPDLPLAKVYELGRFVKNQRLPALSELGTRGPVEVMAAVIHSVIGSLRLEVEALIGDFEEGVAKQNFEFFHLPKVVVHGTVPYVDRDAYLFPRYQFCVVYPWAALLADFAAPVRARLEAIEKALELPGKQALLELFKLKRQAADVRSGLLPTEGLAPLTDSALPQKGVAMPDRLELLGKAGRLRAKGLLSHLGLAEVAVLCSFMERVSAQQGDVIVRQGDTSDDLYLIESGQAQVQIANQAGQVVPLAVFGPNDYFGEVALLTGGERTADVVALTPLALLRLSKDAYTRYLGHVVAIEQQMALTALHRARETARETRSGKS